MAITYNAGTNAITITAGTEAAMINVQNIYDASVAGGWGRMSKQGASQFSFDNGVRLIVGDGSTTTWFGDTNKQIEISDLTGTGWQTFIDKKANANIRFGTLISGKRTKDGCAFYHRPVTNFLELIEGNDASGVVEFLSCFFDFAIVNTKNCSNLKMYNNLITGDYRMTDNVVDIYNYNISNNYEIFHNCTGTFDRIVGTDLTQAIYFGYTTADLTISNMIIKNNTKVAYLSNTAYDVYLVNVDADTWAFTYSSFTGKVYRQYEFDLIVKKSDKTLFANRPITIWQRAGDNNFVDGDKYYTGTTDANGEIPTQTLSWGYYNQANGNTLQQHYHQILIEGDSNHLDYETEFNPDEKQLEEITLVDVTDLIADIAALPTAVENAIAVWDRILTGATHNIATSAGRRVREIGAYAIDGGTAQGGNGFSITLAATASGNDGVYNRNLIVLTDNTGAGQTRTIVDYDATSKVCVVDREWRVSPDATTTYQVVPDDTPLTVDHGRARGGTSTTITLRAYASSVDDTYLCNQIGIIAGPGRGQSRLVGAYNGTTKVVTICGDDWVTTPTTDSIYVMMPYGTTCTSCIGSHALEQIKSEVDVMKLLPFAV